MITFLASPKPFKGIAKEHQYRAVQSWLATGTDVEVILYGDSDGIDEAGSELGVQVVKQIECTSSGIPFFGSIVAHAEIYGKNDLQVYLNCDILLSGVMPALRLIEFTQFLLIGQRINLGNAVFVDLGKADYMTQLIKLAREGKATLDTPSATDYFCFRRGMWRDIPKIIIGRGGYDQALLAYCMRHRIPIIDGTFRVMALHQFHDYNHIEGGNKVVFGGADAEHNFGKGGAGKRSRARVSDAGYVIKGMQLIPWPCRGDWLRKLELKLRHEKGLHKTALALRLIWRGLSAIKIKNTTELTIDDLIDSYSKH